MNGFIKFPFLYQSLPLQGSAPSLIFQAVAKDGKSRATGASHPARRASAQLPTIGLAPLDEMSKL
jgi:hypothetical protein